MQHLDGAEIAEMVDGLVHQETQLEEDAVVLTADRVERITGPPDFDFGGGEYKEGATKQVRPRKRFSDDDYGWWELEPGVYRVRLNESLQLSDGVTGVLQGWWRITANGVQQPTQVLDGDHPELHQLIRVPAAGSNFKENARIAELRAFR